MKPPSAELVARLHDGRDALTPELTRAFEAAGPAIVPSSMAAASSEELLAAPEPEGWAPIFAIRLLGQLRAVDAIPVLVRILEGAEEDDQASAEAGRALTAIGPATLPMLARFLESTANEHGRGIALEVASNIAMDWRSTGEAFDEVRRALERLLHTVDPGTRSVLVQYIGDLGHPDSVTALLDALSRPDLSQREYEAIRDVIERLGETCPDMYFDASGKGYPLDEEKDPLCPACGKQMIIQESGDLRHPEPRCEAAPPRLDAPSEEA